MTQYRLLALDIDGTLLNSSGQLTERTVAAVRAASAAGLKVCLVSGRRAKTMAPFARALGITDPMVCFNGGMIVQPDPLRLLHAAHLSWSAVYPIISAWEASGIPVMVCSDALDGADVYFSGSSHWPPLERYLRLHRQTIRSVSSFAARVDWEPMRVEVMSDAETNLQAAAIADPLLDPAAVRVVLTQDYDRSWYYELYSAQAAKSGGLQWLGEHFGITPGEMIAVGDQVNDLDMIQAAGLGVAMGNAQPEVKAQADLVIGDHDEDGLAVFIEQLRSSRARF